MHKLALAAILLLTATGARAAEAQNNLFISPTGEPFVAPETRPYPIVDWFNKADANHDGKLDIAEFRADAERFFALLDRNHDGFIDSGEINIYEHYYVPEILSQQGADAGGLLVRVVMQGGGYGSGAYGGGAQPGGGQALAIDPNGATAEEPAPRQRLNGQQGAVQFSLFNEPEPVLSADRNLDGRISLKEFRDQSDRHFTALDVKMRGYIVLGDLEQTDYERQVHAKRK
jgi:hypothetical protein